MAEFSRHKNLQVIRGLAEVGAAFPRLKTGGDISPLTHNKAAVSYRQSLLHAHVLQWFALSSLATKYYVAFESTAVVKYCAVWGWEWPPCSRWHKQLISDSTSLQSHLLSGGGRPSSLPNTSEFPDMVNGGRGDSGVKEVVEEAPIEGSPPELFATDDLVEVLLEHNKLLGRLHQFTAPNTDPSIPTSRCIRIIYIHSRSIIH